MHTSSHEQSARVAGRAEEALPPSREETFGDSVTSLLSTHALERSLSRRGVFRSV